MDEDETSIGGLENPPKPTKELFYASLAFDIIGLCLALLVNETFFIAILIYICKLTEKAPQYWSHYHK